MADRTSPLQMEIQQTKPFRSLGQELVVGLLRTADLVRRAVDRTLEPYGVTPQQYNVLRILRGAGDSGLPTLEISGRMLEQAPGITRLLDRLEAKGWVRRERCPQDRRQVLCWLTPPGLALVERLDDPVDDADREAVAMLCAADQERLLHLLEAIRAGHRFVSQPDKSQP
jgi:DNA-binding MarR family transcriptional regulator